MQYFAYLGIVIRTMWVSFWQPTARQSACRFYHFNNRILSFWRTGKNGKTIVDQNRYHAPFDDIAMANVFVVLLTSYFAVQVVWTYI